MFPALFALGFLLLIIRMPEALFRAEFFTDDGPLYAEALQDGPATILRPYAGYWLVVPRVVVFAETLVTPAWAPLFGSLVALAVMAASAAVAASDRMPWPRTTGSLIAIGILALPAAYPMVGTLSRMIWPMTLWIALTALSQEPRTALGRGAESLGLALTAVTGPGAFVVWPLFIPGPRRRLAIVAAGALIQLSILVGSPRPGMVEFDGALLPFVILERVFVTPILGPTLTSTIGPALTIVVGGIVALICGALLIRHPHREAIWIVFLLLALPVAGILSAGVPTGWFANPDLFPRYFWISGAALVVLIARERASLIALPLIVALVAGILVGWRIDPWESANWVERSACIGGPQPCDVPVAPSGDWDVQWRP